MNRILGIACVLIIMGVVIGAVAEEKFGVQVYPGAKLDQATTKFLVEGLKVEGAAYRTSDSAVKVIEFYKGQKNLKTISTEPEGGMFKGAEVTVTVQNPWMDMNTGKKNTDTLISIVKEK